MHVLVSNDDGIQAPGLLALAQAMLPFGKVTVVAPDENQSATGHKKTLERPLRVRRLKDYLTGVEAYSVNGSPSDCVAVALLGYIKDHVDLVVSGINRGPNMAQDVTYSGTVSVALESAIFGLPAVAFSLDDRSPDADYSSAAEVAHRVVAEFCENPFPRMTILNVNIPRGRIKGWKATRQGVREYRDRLDERLDPRGQPYYWIGGEEPIGDVNEVDTDLWAVHNGYVSLTPIHLDLTAHNIVSNIAAWKLEL
ncbi:MAG: 5'/3'-nucleotidase SurE [Anaerolineae bacterium]|nr:MAG: 5'/3'-nucleotidase SurE [Anaerolineae bacterium]